MNNNKKLPFKLTEDVHSTSSRYPFHSAGDRHSHAATHQGRPPPQSHSERAPGDPRARPLLHAKRPVAARHSCSGKAGCACMLHFICGTNTTQCRPASIQTCTAKANRAAQSVPVTAICFSPAGQVPPFLRCFQLRKIARASN